jgi:hypothetical protein
MGFFQLERKEKENGFFLPSFLEKYFFASFYQYQRAGHRRKNNFDRLLSLKVNIIKKFLIDLFNNFI